MSVSKTEGPTASYSGRPDTATALVRFRGRDYGIFGGPCGRHAGLRPANFHSLVHFATSSARNLPNSMGEVEKVLPPKSAYFALIACLCSPSLISPFSKSMIESPKGRAAALTSLRKERLISAAQRNQRYPASCHNDGERTERMPNGIDIQRR